MQDSSTCKTCGATIFWFESKRTGKSYPCNSNSARDFHRCQPRSAPAPQASPGAPWPDGNGRAQHTSQPEPTWNNAPPLLQAIEKLTHVIESLTSELVARRRST